MAFKKGHIYLIRDKDEKRSRIPRKDRWWVLARFRGLEKKTIVMNRRSGDVYAQYDYGKEYLQAMKDPNLKHIHRTYWMFLRLVERDPGYPIPVQDPLRHTAQLQYHWKKQDIVEEIPPEDLALYVSMGVKYPEWDTVMREL